jgi:heme-degrading monooxygenase HmoA
MQLHFAEFQGPTRPCYPFGCKSLCTASNARSPRMVTFTAVSPYERVMTSLLALVCVILASHGLHPAARRNAMSIIRLIHIRLDPSETENALGVWKTECAPLMIRQKGCMSEKLLRCKDEPEFISYSEWESEAAIEAYRNSPAHQEIVRHARALKAPRRRSSSTMWCNKKQFEPSFLRQQCGRCRFSRESKCPSWARGVHSFA